MMIVMVVVVSSGDKGGGIIQVVRLVMATVCRELTLG